MKRYRVMNFDLDTRALVLETEIKEDWEDEVRKLWRQNHDSIRAQLAQEFGTDNLDGKISDFVAMGSSPVSVLAWHNVFFRQVRISFAAGAYYPALVGAGALGERILNHLMLSMRDSFKDTPEYKKLKLHKRQSIDDWAKAIDALAAWEVLRPKAAAALRELRDLRNQAVHFRAELDQDARTPALAAITALRTVVEEQFAAVGPHPWFIPNSRGEFFIKKEWEVDPFVSLVYLPNSALVGPRHTLEWAGTGFRVIDDHDYEEREIDDAEFMRLRSVGNA